ncbi:MAG: NAD(P)-dependent oxidoreductase, partial [Bacteriovorax sp.]|nr:NAD(P)-dependent oxidoreductase [Bacteriovorax sp.]
MKILVTGANGFVGTHLCLKLLNQGHTVYGLVRTPSKMNLVHANFNLLQGDLELVGMPWIHYLPLDLDACIHTAG